MNGDIEAGRVQKGPEGDTANTILENAFGAKYFKWNSIPSGEITLSAEEKDLLAFLVQERDHYEIKRIMTKLAQRSTENTNANFKIN